jgi:flavin reductase (DIM6/NTAB) family NADH-FMN oxidoreductase RutF
MPEIELSPTARALGRIPSGLYIVTTLTAGRPSGFLGSFVVQLGLDPPTVGVAIAKERPYLAAIRAHGRFALSILDGPSRGLMAAFLKKPVPGRTPFDDLRILETPAGLPALADALAWIDCRVDGEHALADHVVVFGTVTAGALLREGEPATHVRKNGLGY